MIRIISKKVLALYPGGGLLQDDFFKKIRQQDPYDQKEDTGIYNRKKNTLDDDDAGFGSNTRRDNPVGQTHPDQDGTSPPGATSYNMDGGPPNDETGPGNSPEGSNPYYTVDTNEHFMDIDKFTNKNRDRIHNNLQQVLKGKPLQPRTPVR